MRGNMETGRSGNGAMAHAAEAMPANVMVMVGPSPEQVLALKAKHPGRVLLLLSSKSGTVVALSPNPEEIAEMQALASDVATAGTAMEQLVRRCVIYPDAGERDAMLARRPLLVEQWCKQLRAAAGDSEVVVPTPAAAADLQALHPGRELVRFSSKAGAVVVKVPNMVEMREWRRRLHDPALRGESDEWLVRSCVVSPAREELNDFLRKKPLLLGKWFRALMEAGGAAEEVEVGEL